MRARTVTTAAVAVSGLTVLAGCYPGFPGPPTPPTTYTTVAEVEPNSVTAHEISTVVSPGSGLRITGTAFGTNSQSGDFDRFVIPLGGDAATHTVTVECDPSSTNAYVVIDDPASEGFASSPCSSAPISLDTTADTIEVSVQNGAGTAQSPTSYAILVRST